MVPDKSYTGRATINIYNRDCMELMGGKPKDHWQLSIVDPPYGIGVSKMNIGARKQKNNSCDGKEWDNKPPTKEYFNQLQRVSKEQIIWGANYFNCFNGRNGAIIWHKNNPLPTSSDCEIASYSKHSKVAIYNKTWTNFVNDKSTSHPTEKPVKLYKWLLTNYAKEGDTILDTHGGSLSIAIACWDLGFDLDVCELDTDYFNDAVKRFETHIAQTQLF